MYLMQNLTLYDTLSGDGERSIERIIEATSVSPESKKAWSSIENYFKSRYLQDKRIGEIEVVINIQNDEKVFINYGCEDNEEVETSMSIADAMDCIKLAAINGLNAAVNFPEINLAEQKDPETLICSIGLLFSL